MKTRVGGIILRAISKKETADFYVAFGLDVSEHSHGGPLHFTSTDFAKDSVLVN
jgi:hypothetical protein